MRTHAIRLENGPNMELFGSSSVHREAFMHPELLLRSGARSEIDTERFDFFEKTDFGRIFLCK